MEQKSFEISITVDATAQQAYEGINDVSKWWTENLEGHSHKLGDEFTVRFGDVHYSRQKLVELVPGKKVVWLVNDSFLSFLKDKTEWTGTRISFEISSQSGKTTIRFTHVGLVPEVECYDACSNAWSQYIGQSLWSLLNSGKGNPEKKENKTGDRSSVVA